MRDLIRAGLQLPIFTFDDPASGERARGGAIFERTASCCVAGEAAGFDSVWVMDHFWQLPFLGGATEEMLEGWTLLGAIAARTSRVNLGTLVSGVTYRNPALLAKTATTLDVISDGRALFGIGAAWYVEEHVGLGFEFPPGRVRYQLLEDQLRIARAMFTEQAPTVEGHLGRIDGAHNVPAPARVGGPPIVVGGAGERHTLRLAAEYADASNLNTGFGEVPHKLDVINGHLADAGRGRDDLNVSVLVSVIAGDTTEEAEASFRGLMASRGMDPAALDDPSVRAMITDHMVIGDVEECAEQIAAAVGPDGLDGVVVNLPAHAGDPDAVHRAGAVMRAAGLVG